MCEGQLGNNSNQTQYPIQREVGQIIPRVMRADQKQSKGHEKEKFLCRRVLVAIVDLLPHCQFVVGTRVEFKWCALEGVEHYIRADNISEVGQRPAELSGYARNEVVKDPKKHNYDNVDAPGTFAMHPVSILVGQRVLVSYFFFRVWLDIGDDGGGTLSYFQV